MHFSNLWTHDECPGILLLEHILPEDQVVLRIANVIPVVAPRRYHAILLRNAESLRIVISQ